MQGGIFRNVQTEACHSMLPAADTARFSIDSPTLSSHCNPPQQGQHPGNNVMGAGRPKLALLCCELVKRSLPSEAVFLSSMTYIQKKKDRTELINHPQVCLFLFSENEKKCQDR